MALAELQNPRSWYNLRNYSNHIYEDSGGQGYYSASAVLHGYYPAIGDFVTTVNKTLKIDENGDV